MDEEQTQDQKWEKLAQKHWHGNAKKHGGVRVEVIEENIWAGLREKQFEYASLLVLERLQLLER